MWLNRKFTQQVQDLASKLVSTITEFQKGTENHDLCVQYALSNFYNHRFLSSDSHKIHKQIVGLIEKFLIHSQPEKSKYLEKSYEEFLDQDISKTSFSKSSVHYDLIDVLLHLSVHPLAQVYHRISTVTNDICVDKFDWASYLLEGEDAPSNWQWDDSSVDSNEESVTNKSRKNEAIFSKANKAIQLFSQFYPNKKKLNAATTKLVSSYWNSAQIPFKPVLKCSLYKPYDILQSKANMTETNVMREVLWLLSGQKDLFVFPLKNGKHCVSSSIYLSHLSNHSLQNALCYYAQCGDIVSKLKKFVISIDLHVSSTYESFAASLSLYLEWLLSDIVSIEKKIKVQKEIFLLSDLHNELSQHLTILMLLKDVFGCSIDCDKENESNYVKVSRLLSVLYATLIDESTILKSNNKDQIELSTVDIIYNLWLDSIFPYLKKIDQWICKGILDDPKSEFIIQRKNAFDNCQHANFWNDALVLAIDNIEDVFPWLNPMLDTIITGGKSMEILQTLSALRQTERNSLKICCFENVLNQSIYQKFLFHLGAIQNQNITDFPKKEIILNYKEQYTNKEVLLQKSFTKLLTPSLPLKSFCRKMTNHFNCLKPLSILVSRALQPVIEFKSNFANHQLVKVLMQEYELQQTLNLFHNFHLMGWGDVMHQFALGIFNGLQTNSLLLDDLVGINVLMQESMGERDMEQRVFIYLKPKSNKEKKEGGLFVTSKNPEKSMGLHKSIDATNCIELQWKVEWPLNLVLTESCISTYNQIFSYLLQIKRAVFCVETLKFSTIYQFSSNSQSQPFAVSLSDFKPMSRNKKRHRMVLLRARLLHLLQHWHSFVMTSVIHAERHTFELKLAEAKTLDEILTAHSSFLDRICSLCLLDGKSQASKLVQGTLQKIMSLAITFNLLWNCGIDMVQDNSLLTHESTFHDCSEFLGRILKTIANRGSIPILDSLAYAILS